MQLFGWTLHSCWMLMTVISVCCCVDIGSSTEINEEVMEEQPWIWNEFKLAEDGRKYNSILDNGVSDDEDNDNMVAIRDRVAPRSSIQEANPILKTASNFRDKQQQGESQQQKLQQGADNLNDDYVYDVEDRPLMADESGQFYGKPTTDMKRSQTGKRRQKQQHSMTPQTISSSLSSAEASQQLPAIGRVPEPRVLPLLGFHSAINKINRQKESLLNSASVNEEEPKLHAEMHCSGLTTSGTVSFVVLAVQRRADDCGIPREEETGC